jgi:ATP-binding cassette subfamily A (ABC1) protein 3
LVSIFPLQDEADILGDRIAIMGEGQLKCLGSSLFLKKAYGVGYQLTIEKKSKKHILSDGDDKNAASVDQDAVDDKLIKIVNGAVPTATLLSNVGTEMSYQLPLAASAAFTGMFEQLDADAENVVTYGVGVTTLDEVFLLVARGGETKHRKTAFASSAQVLQGMSAEDAEKSIRSRMDLENDALVVQHIRALFSKRAVNFKRDKKARLFIPLSHQCILSVEILPKFCLPLFTIHRPGAVQRFCQVSLFLLVSFCQQLSPPAEISMQLN